MSLYALDIETACAVKGCTDKDCKHALIPHQGRITCIGVWSPEFNNVFRGEERLGLLDFNGWLTANPGATFVLQNGKFDFKFLWRHGVKISEDRWVADTCLMATASYNKIPDSWLASYEAKRAVANKKLPKGYSHRKAGKHSLKCLAPYHLGIAPFWENPAEHDNDEYVLKDCEYTYRLYHALLPKLKAEDTFDFYEKRLLPWAKMFLRAEHRGVTLDRELLAVKEKDAYQELALVKGQLDALWAPAFAAYRAIQEKAIREHYHGTFLKAAEKAKDKLKCAARYSQLAEAALTKVEPFSLDSPKQMAWLMRDHFGLNITVEEWDKKRRETVKKDSTGAEVIERLAFETGREDLKVYLRYRELEKLVTAFFPTYKSLCTTEGTLHTNFNLDITKTGRTSSDTPNLQQCPGDLHQLFKARPGYKLITKDFSSIEPHLIGYYSEDEVLCKLLMSGADFHGSCVNAVFETEWDLKTMKKEHKKERDFAKEVDLSVFYGAGKNRVKQSSQKHQFNFTLEQCQAAVTRLRAAWPGVSEFKKYTDKCAEAGEPIESILGRKRLFPDRDAIYMEAFNSRIQGGASDLLLFSLELAEQRFKEEGLDAHLLLTVHDEGIVEALAAHAERAAQIIDECLTGHKLETQWGRLVLRAEGHISDYWSK